MVRNDPTAYSTIKQLEEIVKEYGEPKGRFHEFISWQHREVSSHFTAYSDDNRSHNRCDILLLSGQSLPLKT